MGQRPDELEQEIAGRRQSIDRRVEIINERVRHDISDARAEVETEVQALKDHIPFVGKDGVTATEARQAPDDYLRDHPMALVAAAFGTGVLLNRFFAENEPGTNGRSETREFRASNHKTGKNDSGETSSLKSMLVGPLTSLLNDLGSSALDEARTMLKDATSAASSKVKETVTGKGTSDDAQRDASTPSARGNRVAVVHRPARIESAEEVPLGVG